jgi:dihydropteroate synthase
MRTCTIGRLAIGADRHPLLMAVLNGSPESFYSGSFVSPATVRRSAEENVDAGAAILDIGARSTAPATRPITVTEECTRMDALLTELDGSGFTVSVDTMHPEVLERCINHDIHMLNDIGGLANVDLAARAAEAGLAACAMAALERPGDPLSVDETLRALSLALSRAEAVELKDLVLDPGIGLWTEQRTVELDWELCCAFDRFVSFDRPVLAAISRKTFLGRVTGRPPEERLAASLAVTQILLRKGAALVRTHDIHETADLLAVHRRLEECS